MRYMYFKPGSGSFLLDDKKPQRGNESNIVSNSSTQLVIKHEVTATTFNEETV